MALINGTAILVIVAAILALVATSKVTHLAENVSATMTDAVLSRIDVEPQQLLAAVSVKMSVRWRKHSKRPGPTKRFGRTQRSNDLARDWVPCRQASNGLAMPDHSSSRKRLLESPAP
jgi:hypothetical protein